MQRIVLRRLVQILPLILGVIVLNFTLIQFAPGTLLDVMSADQQVSDPQLLDRMRTLYGLDQPAIVQLWKYVWSILTLDFGFSYRQNAPVLDVILMHLPATILLMLSSIAIALLVGVTAGVIAAVKVNSLWDNLISLAAIFFFAAPTFWLGIMLTILFSVKLGLLPVGGMRTIGLEGGLIAETLDVARHLVLPALSLGLFYSAVYARVMRASMLEVLRLDFTRTARAKGLPSATIVVRHVLRNALLPVVTLLGLQLGTVVGGSVVVEAVFSWPGIGSLMLDSVMSRNYPMVLGILVLSSLVVAVSNALIDLAYFKLDPRIQAR